MIFYTLVVGAIFCLFVPAGYFYEKSFRFDRPPQYYLSCVVSGILVYPTLPMIYYLLGEIPTAFIGLYLLTTATIASCLGIAIFKYRHLGEYAPPTPLPSSTNKEANTLNLGLKP